MKYGVVGFSAFLAAPGLLEGGHWLLHIGALAAVVWCAWRGGLFYGKEKAPCGSGVPTERR